MVLGVPVRRLALVVAVGAALLACAFAAQTAAAQVTERLPDLVSDQPQRLQLQTVAQPDGNHLLLRFDGFVHNAGQGALEMRGSNPVGTEYTNVVQRVYRSDSSFLDDSSRDPHIIFEPEDGHDHWHLKNAARYSLWNAAKTAEVAPAMKVGFCLIDSQRIETNGPPSPGYSTGQNNFCGQNEPTRPSLFEGVSAGWRDLYDRTLAFQWVDVSDVAPGNYWVRADVDPDDVVREINEVNAGAYFGSTATVPWTIPGYAANPVAAGTISATGPTTIPLSTTSFGTGLGTRTFRIIVPPRHGTLNVALGPTFTNTSVVYTPRPGWVGPDSFSYTVRNSSSSFPRYPTAASVTLNVGGVSPNVGISGAPASMFTGTSARLLATVTADDPQVSWTVNGIPEGNSQVGTVDPFGLYVAPATPPPGGQVTIRATTASGAFGEVTILIAYPSASAAGSLGGRRRRLFGGGSATAGRRPARWHRVPGHPPHGDGRCSRVDDACRAHRGRARTSARRGSPARPLPGARDEGAHAHVSRSAAGVCLSRQRAGRDDVPRARPAGRRAALQAGRGGARRRPHASALRRPEPRLLERPAAIAENLEADGEPGAGCPQVRPLLVQLDAARPGPATHAHQREHPLTVLDEVLRLDAELVPVVAPQHALDHLAHAQASAGVSGSRARASCISASENSGSSSDPARYAS